MLSSALLKYTKKQSSLRQIILIILFFLIGFGLSYSSGGILPLIHLHEAGHYTAAKILGVHLEREDVNTYIMYPEKGGKLNKYICVLRAGYMTEILFWALGAGILLLVNLRRVRHVRAGIHYPAALLPGYAASLFRKLPGSSDMQEIARLAGVSEAAAVRDTALRGTIAVTAVLGLYVFLLLRMKGRSEEP